MRSIGVPPAPRMGAATPGGAGQGDDDGRYFRISRTIPFELHYTV
jgi:hypothetical protein